MPLPWDVYMILGRIHNPETRRKLQEALERWEYENRTLTTAMLAQAHRIQAKLKHVHDAVHLLHNPLLGRLLLPLDAYLVSASVLEAAIRYLARHYERRGQLTDRTRRHFEELVRELARVEQR